MDQPELRGIGLRGHAALLGEATFPVFRLPRPMIDPAYRAEGNQGKPTETPVEVVDDGSPADKITPFALLGRLTRAESLPKVERPLPPDAFFPGCGRTPLTGYGNLSEREYRPMDLRTDCGSHSPAHEVREAATDRLRKTPYQALRALSCEYDRGVLFLRGQLPTFYQKQLAQEAVVGLAGVVQVVNETEVALSSA
ncbi:MAG: BON domain-containing protein [Planctomycetota bacterium]